MATNMRELLASKSFRRRRKVDAQLHALTPQKMKLLRESTLADFFDVGFLREVGLGRSEQSLGQLGRHVRQLFDPLGYKTVADVEEHCNPYLLGELEGWGEETIAFLFDLFQALGLKWHAMRPVNGIVVKSGNGRRLAEQLGFRKAA